MIEFKNFSCYYKNKKEYITALDGVSFTVERGELMVVLGPSGCGKTTLLRCILGMCEYLAGELTVDGVNVDSLRLQESNVGYVRQEYGLYPHMTVYENIAFPLRMIRTSQEEVDRRVKELAKILEVDFLLTRKPKQLSGGQMQRIALARALIKNPVILLLDEPFSNLEPEFRGELRRLVKKVHEIYGCTMVFVTHDTQDAFALADRILLMEAGSVQALGTPLELMQKGYLS